MQFIFRLIKEVSTIFAFPIVIQGIVTALSLASTMFYAQYVSNETENRLQNQNNTKVALLLLFL